MTEKLITICSDDFGQNRSIDDGILKLINLGRLHAVTVFTESPRWQQSSAQLQPFEHQIDIGIHLNLTESFPDFPKKYSLNKLLMLSHLRWLNKDAIKSIFRKQIELFQAQMGRLPDFLDGHQHIHAFPVINQALQEVILEFWGNNPTLYVRDSSKLTFSFDGFLFKKIILHLACRHLTKKMATIDVPTTSSFTGVYDFNSQANYAQLVNDWLATSKPHTLMMCHPACDPMSDEDALHEARVNEFNYLSSNQFLSDCERLRVKLTRYSTPHPNLKVST